VPWYLSSGEGVQRLVWGARERPSALRRGGVAHNCANSVSNGADHVLPTAGDLEVREMCRASAHCSVMARAGCVGPVLGLCSCGVLVSGVVELEGAHVCDGAEAAQGMTQESESGSPASLRRGAVGDSVWGDAARADAPCAGATRARGDRHR